MLKLISIAIDANEANVHNRVGSNVYAFELLTKLEKSTRRSRKEFQFQILLSSPPVADFPKARIGWQYQVLKPSALWTQWALPIYLFWNASKLDVLLTLGHYAPRISAIPYISAVMDTAYLDFPEQFRKKDLLQLKWWTEYSVRNATKVITISEATKKNIIDQYKKAASDISVIYPAYNPPTKQLATKNSKKKFRLNDTFLLYVGTLQPRKNIIRLVEAFEQLCLEIDTERSSQLTTSKGRKKAFKSKGEIQLVLAGKEGWLSKPIIDRIDTSPFKQQIIRLGYVSEADKVALIQESSATVLVGLHEGFGIPPLEAMHLGSIPLVANTASLPEVVGEAGILVDPYDVSDIKEGLNTALGLTARERAKLLKKAREQRQKFSWEASAKNLLLLIREVAQKS